MFKYLIPLVLFIILAVFLAIGLKLDPKEVPSPLIGKPAPHFSAARLHTPEQLLTPDELKGQVWLFNVWASWCASCRAEHPLLNQLAQQKAATLIGLNYKDDPMAAKAWLAQWGNPYQISVLDQDGRIGIDWGVYGVPETFIIDKQGIIRYKHIGPVTAEVIQQVFLPLINQLQTETP